MSLRKPAGESWESLVDRRIREAQERGEFDDLPGAGKPLTDLDRPRDDLWWVRRKLEEEGLSYLPPALQIRKDLEDARDRISRAGSEHEVREMVADINERIRDANGAGDGRGPSSSVMPLDEEATVRDWERSRPDRA